MTDSHIQKHVTYLVAGISSFVVPFMASAINVALPQIGTEFSLGAVAQGWIVTAYLLATAAGLLPAGRIADILGKKEVFVAGMGVFALSSMVSAIAPSYAVLLVSRIVAGVGSAMGFATGTAILVSVASLQERGRILGWNVAAVYIGLSMGPTLGGMITHAMGWEWVFVIAASSGLLTVILAAWALKREPAAAGGESFDLAGAVCWCMALIGLMYGLPLLPNQAGIGLVIFGGVCAVAFLWWEYRAPSPLLDVAAFSRNQAFVFSNLAALINYSATMAVVYLLNLYLQYQKGLSVRHAGLILVIQPLVMAVVSPVSGRLSDRIEPVKLASAGMALTVVVLAAFSFLGPGTSLWLLGAGLAVLGLCFGMFSSPNMNAVMSSVEKKHYGVASSTLATMRVVGQTLSMSVTTLIMTLYLGSEKIGPGNLPGFMRSMNTAFAVSAALCVLGVFASLARGRVRPGSQVQGSR